MKDSREIDLSYGLTNENGIPTKNIEYAMFSGIVIPDKVSLFSDYNKDISGVIWTIKKVEHYSEWKNEKWEDHTRTIHSEKKDVPFKIVTNSQSQTPFTIKINNPMNANYLFENLQLTYEKYDKKNESITQALLDLVFTPTQNDEIIRGTTTTEHMLKTNTPVIAFGKLKKIDKYLEPDGSSAKEFYELSEPEDKEYSFIITSLSRSQLIDNIKFTTRFTRFFLLLFATIGIVVGVRFIYTSRAANIARSNQINNS